MKERAIVWLPEPMQFPTLSAASDEDALDVLAGDQEAVPDETDADIVTVDTEVTPVDPDATGDNAEPAGVNDDTIDDLPQAA